MKRTVSILLIAAMICSLLGACGSTEAKSAYITKGEYFALFIEENNLYSTSTATEYEDSTTYEPEAEIMAEWGLIDEQQKSNLDDDVTKEIVAQTCVRNMAFRQECEAEIKDIEKCHDAQAVTDAVGMGIFALENGYFDAAQRLTRDECIAAMDKADEIDAYTTFDCDEDFELEDDVVVLDGSEIAEVEFIDEDGETIESESQEGSEEETETTDSSGKTSGSEEKESEAEESTESETETTKDTSLNISTGVGSGAKSASMDTGSIEAVSLTACASSSLTALEEDSESAADAEAKTETDYSLVRVYIKEFAYRTNKEKYAVGNTLTYWPQDVATDSDLSIDVTFAGRIIENAGCTRDGDIILLLEPTTDITKLLKNNTKNNQGRTTGVTGSISLSGKIGSNDVSITASDSGVEASLKHTFTLKGDQIYTSGSWSTWANAEASPSITLTLGVDNINITTKDFAKLVRGDGGSVKLSFDTTIGINADAGGLRYSPANNGNGGFLSNLSRSRWTGAQAGGSEKIKIAKVTIPFAFGFSLDCWLYLYIKMDGSLEYEVTQSHTYTLTSQNGNYSISKYSDEPKRKAELNANIEAGLSLSGDLKWCWFSIIDPTVSLGVGIDAVSSIFTNDEKQERKADCVYLTTVDLADVVSDYLWCMDSEIYMAIEFAACTSDSIVGKLADALNCLSKLKKRWEIPLFSLHYENDNGLVEKCTRGGEDSDSDDSLEISSDGTIEVDSYKETLTVGEGMCLKITAVPIKEEKIEENGGITVESYDEDIVTASYNEATGTIRLNAESAGSTEIEIKIKKEKGTKEYYSQWVSVTVNDEESGGSGNGYSGGGGGGGGGRGRDISPHYVETGISFLRTNQSPESVIPIFMMKENAV